MKILNFYLTLIHKNLNEYRYLNSQKKQENAYNNQNTNDDCDKVLIDEFLQTSKNKDFFNESSYSKMDNVEYLNQEQEEYQYQQEDEKNFMKEIAILRTLVR